MKHRPITSLVALFVLALSIGLPLHAGAAPLRLLVVGDSTVCDYPAENPRGGWGQYLQGYFTPNVVVVNKARAGCSSKSYLAEGLWDQAMEEHPDIVLIQFGHNDARASDDPIATDAATTYSENLRKYVAAVRAAGAHPILVTPMNFRRFNGDGIFETHVAPYGKDLATYAAAMKKVAAAKKVPVIDLYDSSTRLYIALGKEKCRQLGCVPDDFTHFSKLGAIGMAALVMKELPTAEPRLAKEILRNKPAFR